MRKLTLLALTAGLSLAGLVVAIADPIPAFKPTDLQIPATAADFNKLIAEINAGGGTVVSGVSTVSGSGGVSCSPTSGAAVCSLVNTAVTPGTYTSANLTVSADGRLTAASNGSGGGAVSSVTGTAGQITVSPTTGATVVSLPATITQAETFSAATTLSAGGTFGGTFSGNFTFSGQPTLTGLPSVTCALNVVLDSGNHLGTAACGGGGGGVSSVGLSVPGTSIFGVTGSPVTTSGTLGLTTTGTSGGVPYFSSTTQLATSAALGQYSVVIGGGPGAAPATPVAIGTAGQVLTSNGAGANPSFQTVSGTGSVTSVGFSVPGSSIFGATGSPVTTSGTLGLTTTGTSGGVPYFSSGTQLTTSAALTQYGVVIGGGPGAAPTATAAGTATTLLHGNPSGTPTFSSVATADIANNAVGNAQAAQAGANTMKGNWTGGAANVSDNAMPSCADTGGNHLNYVSGTGITCGTSGGGGGTPVIFTGTTAGTANAQTLAVPVPTGFTLTDGYVVRVKIGAGLTNTAAVTLNVNSTGATAVNTQDTGGINALVGGELVAGRIYDLQYNATSSSFVRLPMGNNATVITTSQTPTAANWANCDTYITSTASLSITLPVATSLTPKGCLLVSTIGVQVSLVPNAADGINGGTINTAINLPADGIWQISTSGASGTGAIVVPLGPIQYWPATWVKGMDLSNGDATNGIAIPIGRAATPRTVTGINCVPTVLVGGAATIEVWTSASPNIPPTSSTQLTSTTCNANVNAGTNQALTLASTSVPQGYWVFIIAKGAGWATSAGWGAIQVSFR